MERWTRRALSLSLALGLAASLEAAEIRIGSAIIAVSAPEADGWGARIDRMVASGELALARTQADPDFAGRRHLRYDQRYAGLRVYGQQLVRQVDAGGRTLTVFGRILDGLVVDPNPAVTEDQAVRLAEADMGRGALPLAPIERVVLPLTDRTVLAYTFRVTLDHRLDRYFVDAHSGAVALKHSELRTTAAVGLGRGVWDDRKKMSVDSFGGSFRAEDRLRPALIATHDLKFDFGQLLRLFQGGVPDPAFVGLDSDNTWTDGAVVDAHAYAGFTYDYYFKRHNRRGLDDRDSPIISSVHGLQGGDPLATNAFWNGSGMFYGDGDGVVFNSFAAGIDVVAHELTHGVTQFSWDGGFSDQSGALNESFSDIIAAGVEFFFQPAGRGRQMADYFLGEDISFSFAPETFSFRSMENPTLFGDPDHFSRRRTFSSCTRDNDFCAIHSNSTIPSHAFFLLIEGGTNRTSGITVMGLGAANRERAERIFYRGFTAFLTPNAQFSDARAATIRAAVELFGVSSNEAQQTTGAWAAVGVQ